MSIKTHYYFNLASNENIPRTASKRKKTNFEASKQNKQTPNYAGSKLALREEKYRHYYISDPKQT